MSHLYCSKNGVLTFSIQRDSTLYNASIQVTANVVEGVLDARDQNIKPINFLSYTPPLPMTIQGTVGPFTYVVRTKTANSPTNSATDDIIFCKLKGTKGSTSWLAMGNSKLDDRKLNQTDQYTFIIGNDIGKLISIQFRAKIGLARRESGEQFIDDWKIASVQVRDVNHGNGNYSHNQSVLVGDGDPPKNPIKGRAKPIIKLKKK